MILILTYSSVCLIVPQLKLSTLPLQGNPQLRATQKLPKSILFPQNIIPSFPTKGLTAHGKPYESLASVTAMDLDFFF